MGDTAMFQEEFTSNVKIKRCNSLNQIDENDGLPQQIFEKERKDSF